MTKWDKVENTDGDVNCFVCLWVIAYNTGGAEQHIRSRV